MKIIIEVKLENPERCEGCCCLDFVLDRCSIFKKELSRNLRHKYIRCKECINKFGGV